jgi:hypothetical protein
VPHVCCVEWLAWLVAAAPGGETALGVSYTAAVPAALLLMGLAGSYCGWAWLVDNSRVLSRIRVCLVVHSNEQQCYLNNQRCATGCVVSSVCSSLGHTCS